MFDELNLLILKNPAMLEHLRILFYIKLWALILVACFFIYLVYFSEDRVRPATRPREKPPFRFYA